MRLREEKEREEWYRLCLMCRASRAARGALWRSWEGMGDHQCRSRLEVEGERQMTTRRTRWLDCFVYVLDCLSFLLAVICTSFTHRLLCSYAHCACREMAVMKGREVNLEPASQCAEPKKTMSW
jgi:hypothetical protein